MNLQAFEKLLNLPKLTVLESSDKYGKLVTIDELKLTVYKKDLELALDQFVESTKFAMSGDAFNSLCELSKRDNQYAEYLGMRKYEVLCVQLLHNNWFGVTIRFLDNGEQRNVIETGLSYALHSEKNMRDYLNGGKHYFTAGGLKDDDVDFIFHGVGHSSRNELYSFDPGEMIMLGALS